MAKKKNKKDYWENSEDQEALADAFFDALEDDELAAWGSEDKSPSAFDTQLENLITGASKEEVIRGAKESQKRLNEVDERITVDEHGNESIDVGDLLGQIEAGELDDIIEAGAELNAPLNPAIDSIVNARSVSAIVLPELERVIIDDGIAPNSFQLDTESCEELKFIDGTDDADCKDLIELMLTYLITLKHPSAIYTQDEFLELFKNVKSYSDVAYNFFTCEDFVFCYRVNFESMGRMIEFIDGLKPSLNEKMMAYLSLAYTAGNHETVFLTGDDDYVVMMYESLYNAKETFAKGFLNDSSTVIVDEDAESFDALSKRLGCLDPVYFIQDRARDCLEVFLNDNDPDDDDDDDDEDDEIGPDYVVKVEPEDIAVESDEESDNADDIEIEIEDDTQTSDDIDNVIEALQKQEEEKIEAVKEVTTIAEKKEEPKKQDNKPAKKQQQSTDDDMTIPVIRRGAQ